ncbi:MAG TPA: S9 family peptidase [Luteimonas sp.]
MDQFSIEDLFQLTTLAEPTGSPEHGRIVFSASRALREGDCYQSRLWLLDTTSDAPPKPITCVAFSASSPVLDPGGNCVAFLSSRDGGQQVHVLPLDGGEAGQLTHSARALKSLLQWTPDGSRLLATAQVAWAEDAHDDIDADGRPLVINFLPYKLDGMGPQVGHRTLLLEIDTGTGEERVLVEGDFDVAEARWSPDGERLAWIQGRSGAQRHRLDLWIADAGGGNARQVTHGLPSMSGLRWSPDGRTIAFGGSATEGDSMSELYLLDVESGKLRQPVEGTQLEGNQIVWHPDGQRLATIAARRGLQEVLVIDLAKGSDIRVDAGLQQASSLCASGERLAFVAAQLRRPDEIHVVGWDGGEETVRSRFNTDWFEARQLPRVDKRSFQVPDGDGGTEEVEAWVLLPAGGDGPFPLLVDFHGGPQSHVLIDYASHVYWYELLSQGWAVLAPNAAGSGSYGVEFARRMIGRWGELDLPQVLSMVDTLQEEGVASDRLACTGKSYGGYLAAWAIGQTSRFGRAVISAPVADIESHTGTSDTGYYVNPYSMGGEIDEVRERYHRLSPIEYCQRIDTPTLVLQGQDDQRCPIGQAEEFFANLVRCAAEPARMVVYPGGSHALAGTGRPSHRLDYHHRLAHWLRGES